MLAVDDATEFIIEVLTGAFDDAVLDSGELLFVEGHSLARAVPRDLVLDRLEEFLGEALRLDQNDALKSRQHLHHRVLIQSIHELHRQIK